MNTDFHDSDCATHSEPAYPAGECDCRLAEIATWEAAYNAVCDERDAIVQDNDKAHALLRQALAALNAVINDRPYLAQCKASAAAIKGFLECGMINQKYMVSVTGSNAPSHIHTNFTDAKAEAERLSKLKQNFDRTIHIVEIKAALKPVQSHEWVKE